MNMQKAYDKIRTYFSKPGADFGVDRDAGMCRYRIGGRKCAVGVLIPDETYDWDMEDATVQEILDKVYGYDGYDVDFLVFCEKAQTAHDSEAFSTMSVPASREEGCERNTPVDERSALIARCEELEGVLMRIASPKRSDGTYNLSREACEQLAKEALRHADT